MKYNQAMSIIMRYLFKQVVLLIITVMLIYSCNNNNEATKAQLDLATVDNISVGYVKIFNLKNGKLLFTSRIKNGKFNTFYNKLNNNDLYLYKIYKPKSKQSFIRALAYGSSIKKLKGKINITFLSELQYRYLKNKKTTSKVNLDKSAKFFISKDINGDNKIDNLDILSFDLKNDKNLSYAIKNNLNKIKSDIYSLKPFIWFKVGTIETPYPASNLVYKGRYGFIQENALGLQLVKLDNISRPKTIGYMQGADLISKIAIKNKYLYIADSNGLAILDISKPTHPKVANRLKLGFIVNIGIIKHYIIAFTLWNRIFCIDIENPKKPKIIYKLMETPKTVRDIAYGQGYIYLADGNVGLKIMDARDLPNLKIVGNFSVNYASNVKFSKGNVYLIDKDRCLLILSTKNPKNLKPISSIKSRIRNFYLLNRYIFLTLKNGDIETYDLKNLKQPQFISRFGIKEATKIDSYRQYLLVFKSKNIDILRLLFR